MIVGVGNPKLTRADKSTVYWDLISAMRADVLRREDARKLEAILQKAYLREAGTKPERALEFFRPRQKGEPE